VASERRRARLVPDPALKSDCVAQLVEKQVVQGTVAQTAGVGTSCGAGAETTDVHLAA
jgi:hypothetical protein